MRAPFLRDHVLIVDLRLARVRDDLLEFGDGQHARHAEFSDDKGRRAAEAERGGLIVVACEDGIDGLRVAGKIAPEIRQVVQDDGKVRLVLKDWPILGEVSKIAARMALAAKYQDKFVEAHDALIGVSSRLTEPRIRELLAAAGINIDRLNGDLTAKAKEIDAILARNSAQAEAFEFRGTPSFIVGKFRVPGILTMAQFEQVIADARKAKASN